MRTLTELEREMRVYGEILFDNGSLSPKEFGQSVYLERIKRRNRRNGRKCGHFKKK